MVDSGRIEVLHFQIEVRDTLLHQRFISMVPVMEHKLQPQLLVILLTLDMVK